MSDLSALFPDLPPEILNGFDASDRAYQSNAPLQVGGEQAQVTDDQIAAYLQSVGSLRAPLPPVVSGQSSPPTPQFVNNGRVAPSPDNAYVEAPDNGDFSGIPDNPVQTPPNPYTSQPPTATEQTPLPVSPSPTSPPPTSPPTSPPQSPLPPAAPLTTPQDAPGAPQTPDLDLDPTLPPPPPSLSRAQGMEALVELWDGDPALRNLVAGYLTTGRTGLPPSAAPDIPPAPPYAGGQPSPQYLPPPPPQPQPSPTYPAPQYPSPQAPSPYDQYGVQPYPPQPEFADPTLRALYDQNATLQARLDRIESSQQYSADQYNRSQLAHYEQIVESTVSKFGSDYAVPPAVLKSVRETAARLGAANTYMNGTHPVTGLPVRPDPHEAVKTALSIAYYATPQAQELERNRTIQRAQSDATRRQRLSGVGGSSASVPRNPPQPTTQADRQSAMVSEMREMFNGSWTGPNSN